MPGRTAGNRGVQSPILTGRFWLTPKGYRVLGIQLPDDIEDDETVVLREIR
jgi:hypothetical protein